MNDKIKEYKGYKLNFYSSKENPRWDDRYQTFKPRPYDDQDYYGAYSYDKNNWIIVYKGKRVNSQKGSFEDIVDFIEERNKEIKPRMMYDSLNNTNDKKELHEKSIFKKIGQQLFGIGSTDPNKQSKLKYDYSLTDKIGGKVYDKMEKGLNKAAEKYPKIFKKLMGEDEIKESYSSENFNETTLDEIIAGEIDNMMSDDINKELSLFNKIKKALRQQKENEIIVLISDYFDFDINELNENTYNVEIIKELNPATVVYKIADDLIMVQEHRNGKVFDYFASEEDANRFKKIINDVYDSYYESLEEDYNGVVIGKYIDPHKENYEDVEYSQYPNYDKTVEVIGGQTVDVRIYPVNYKEKNLGHSAYFALKTTDGGFKHHMPYIYNLKSFIDKGEIELTNGWEWSDDYPHLVKKNEN